MWIYFSKFIKDMKILVCHVNAHQNITSGEEEFSNQIDNMTVDSQLLSPTTSVIA